MNDHEKENTSGIQAGSEKDCQETGREHEESSVDASCGDASCQCQSQEEKPKIKEG